jgi:ABC-type phosphate transport system substrate-binding protein
MQKALASAFGLMLALWGISLAPGAVPSRGISVVANPETPMLDEDTLQKVYLGKIVEVNGLPVIPVNLAKGTELRKEFMENVLSQDDDKFIAYWTVRRYIGKGSPPKEFESIESQLAYLRNTPGAIGYVPSDAAIRAGLKTLMKKP